jgi:Tol biopolymer transport system component
MKHMFAIGALLALCGGAGIASAENPVERCKNHFILNFPCGRPNPAPPGMLAFVSERDGNSEIYVMNTDGTGLLRLTHDPGVDADPAWSPDGKRIAFASDRAGNSDIYVMDADGANLARLTQTGSNYSPAWSPDGNEIAFSSLRGGQTGIYVMSVDGDRANPRLVGFDRGANMHPAWSPDGEQIAFVSDWRVFDTLFDVYVMNADGSDITMMFAGPFFWVNGLTYYFQPAWSPDGGRIAVVVCPYAWNDCYPDSSVAVANADGSGLKTLVKTSGFARPTWSPDGATIAFSTRECPTCVGELRYVSADGSKSGVIFSNGHDPAWRPVDGALVSPTTNPTARRSPGW